jgi:hypothetical protein
VRFLLALPILIGAELIVHSRLQSVLRNFVQRGLVIAEDLSKFSAAAEAAMRTRNSLWLEFALLVFTYTAGHWIWLHQGALRATTWYAFPDGTGIHLTIAGYWYAFVSIPIFQFILLRWYMRFMIWFFFLWRVSGLNLRLLPAHPDGAGGIGFLGKTSYAFAPLVFAQGVLMSGWIASRIFHRGESLMSFKVSVVAFIGFLVLVILGPLAVFTPQLARAKRRGLSEYGMLATTYVTDFDEKWVRGGAKGEEILGTNDIQSLADLANSYAVIGAMRLVPFSLNDTSRLAVAAALPILPLLLTIMPLDEVVTRLLKVIF